MAESQAPRLSPSRPLAERVERSGEAAERGVGGLRLIRIRGVVLRPLAPSKRRPPPLTPPRHALRARGEGNREERGVRVFIIAIITQTGRARTSAAPWSRVRTGLR